MKRLLVISYWVVSILLVSIVLTSLGYRFPEAVFIGTMFLPGALAAKYFFPKVDFRDRPSGIKDTVFIVLGILFGELLLFLVAHFCIITFRAEPNMTDIPQLLTNPVFIVIILTALAAGGYFFESWLDRKRPTAPAPITFTSERKSVTLPVGEILYVESNDDITTVFATGGRRFKNITPISRWEAILKPHFIRIHRSYLVNKAAVTDVDVDILLIGETQLPISRKYKEEVLAFYNSRQSPR
ncbi:MAG: LytTR family transcriptional regulator [Bacteroidales bacterium]|nr:LytTR family transcriptional regulator [Bacteroidales bacterium]